MVHKHIVKSFDKELFQLKDSMLEMCDLVRKHIDNTHKAFINNDLDAYKHIKANDKLVDKLDSKIVNLSLSIFSLRNPVAYDLRISFAGSHISRNLERIGDNISNLTQAMILMQRSNKKIEKKILSTLSLLSDMLYDTGVALKNNDKDFALRIITQDKKIDTLYKEIGALTIDTIQKNPTDTSSLSAYLFASRYLERIGDHISNICRYIHYISTGNIYYS